jgi:predicted transposase YdaD
MSAESILHEGLDGLLPLVLFTKDGKQAEVLDEVVGRLAATQDKELMALTYTLAGLIFQNNADRDTVMRRFAMLEDIIEQSWIYQEIKRKGLAEGKAEGKAEERQEWLQTQRNGLISVAQARFPDLVAEATERANRVEDPHVLQDVMLKVALAQNSEEAKKHLQEMQ